MKCVCGDLKNKPLNFAILSAGNEKKSYIYFLNLKEINTDL